MPRQRFTDDSDCWSQATAVLIIFLLDRISAALDADLIVHLAPHAA
jgi:hypothetical protein